MCLVCGGGGWSAEASNDKGESKERHTMPMYYFQYVKPGIFLNGFISLGTSSSNKPPIIVFSMKHFAVDV